MKQVSDTTEQNLIVTAPAISEPLLPFFFYPVALRTNAGHGPILEVSISHSLDAQHSVELLWTSYHFVSETSDNTQAEFEPTISAGERP
jgi:hypothetical protein